MDDHKPYTIIYDHIRLFWPPWGSILSHGLMAGWFWGYPHCRNPTSGSFTIRYIRFNILSSPSSLTAPYVPMSLYLTAILMIMYLYLWLHITSWPVETANRVAVLWWPPEEKPCRLSPGWWNLLGSEHPWTPSILILFWCWFKDILSTLIR